MGLGRSPLIPSLPHLLLLLGPLLRVDLIKWVLNVRPSVRPSARLQKVSSISVKLGISVEVDE